MSLISQIRSCRAAGADAAVIDSARERHPSSWQEGSNRSMHWQQTRPVDHRVDVAGAADAARAVNVANGSRHEWWPATSSMATIPLHDNGESPDLLPR